MKTTEVKWNPKTKLLVSDVDETLADLFVPMTPEMAEQVNGLLLEKKALFLVTGAGLQSVKRRITDLIKPELRQHVLISHCSGAEVCGFDESGEELRESFYSLYDHTLTTEQKEQWRKIVQQVVTEFHLEPHPTMPVKEFKQKFGDNPLAVMLDDRGPQITFEFINGFDVTPDQMEKLQSVIPTLNSLDLRNPVQTRITELLEKADIPITPRFGGTFALDLALKGVSKTTSVKFALENDEVLAHVGLKKEDVEKVDVIEVWGDKFAGKGGTDRGMTEALAFDVRSIDFRAEDASEFPKGYNIVLWDGQKHLHEGLLEYLQARGNNIV